MYFRITLLIAGFTLIALEATIGQVPTGDISGVVIDRDSRQPLPGATVIVLEKEEFTGTTTDQNGNFSFRNLPVGRRSLEISYVGYETRRLSNLNLTSGRELEVEIKLSPAAIEAAEVTVRPERADSDPVNPFSTVSSRSFTVEETQRYAASVNDPGRLAVGFPGVQPQRDTRTDIFVRGNSAAGVSWRLMGVDIPNPNHFARIGSSGGGISIFSASLLSTSDFSSGAFPAEYGNATAGVFDMKFRRGNRNRRQHTLRAGILGLDFATEGPIKKGESSYLVNYRYSTLGLLNEMGIHLVGERISNTFQDLSFVTQWSDNSNNHRFTLWGIGGVSRENENVVEDRSEWRTYTDYLSYDFDTDMGAIGINHNWLIDEQSYLVNSVAVMGQKIGFQYDTTNLENESFTVDDQVHRDNRITLNSTFNHRISPELRLKTGLQASIIRYSFFRERYNFESKQQEQIVDGSGTTGLYEAFIQTAWEPHPRWLINAGLRGMHFALNSTSSLEPRISAAYNISESMRLQLAYGLHGMTLPLGSYFTRTHSNPDALPNKSLDLLKSHHFVLAHTWDWTPDWRLNTEFYYQIITNAPVVDDPDRTYWLLNEIQQFADEPLVSSGYGYNRGVDVTLERFFDRGVFMILSGSIFRSQYEPLDGQKYPTQFDSRYAGTLMGGYEWDMGNGQRLELGAKVIYTAGLPIMPLLEDGPVSDDREPVYDESNPFSIQVRDYFRTDLRIAWRRNNPNNSWILSLDLQNATSRRNVDIVRRQFDPDINEWVYNRMAGLTPILSFQIDF